MRFFARNPQPRERAGHDGHTYPETPSLSKLSTKGLQRGIGLRTRQQRHPLARGRITAGLPPARMEPWGNHAHGAAPLQPCLDNRAADPRQSRQGVLRAAVFS